MGSGPRAIAYLLQDQDLEDFHEHVDQLRSTSELVRAVQLQCAIEYAEEMWSAKAVPVTSIKEVWNNQVAQALDWQLGNDGTLLVPPALDDGFLKQ